MGYSGNGKDRTVTIEIWRPFDEYPDPPETEEERATMDAMWQLQLRAIQNMKNEGDER